MSHFYLTLPSNSSANYYDNNTLTKFSTRLQSSMSLKGDWEVGLSEIIFPHTWMTLNKEDATFRVSWLEYPGDHENKKDMRLVHGDAYTELHAIEYCIPPGYYDTVNEVLYEMDKVIEKMSTQAMQSAINVHDNIYPRFVYNETNKRTKFIMQKYQSLSLSSNLATILGVTPNQNPSRPNVNDKEWMWEGETGCDLSVGINYMMVYCDLLEHVPVGDTKVPLLRIVDASGSNGEIVHRAFDDARYIPLQKKHFDSIEIDIRDDLGKPIPFETGKLVVTLHFRQCESSYFLG